MRARRLGAMLGASGQAAVETVAVIPLILVVGLAGFQVLAARAAHSQAQSAAAAAAIALQAGADPREAAAATAPDLPPGRLRVRVDDRRVIVRVRPKALWRGLARRLTAESVAHAGRTAPARELAWWTMQGGDGRSGGEPAPATTRADGHRPRDARPPDDGRSRR